MKFSYQTAKIISIKRETPRVKTFTLNTSLAAKPSQYVMLWAPGINEKPFGVVTNNPLRLSIAKVGSFTEHIHTLKVGDKMTFRGPYGSSFHVAGRHPLLVGGGYGVVPLYLLTQAFSPSVRRKTTVIIGAKTKKDLAFISKFRSLGCRVQTSTDDGTFGFHGFSTDLAKKVIQSGQIDSVYACGPEPMMKKVAEMSREDRIPCQVSLERHFKCGGMGICGSCSFNGKLVCVDGPVFPGSLLL
jgi:dihydroorotate dehydrogenase electron transfer subunit